MFDRVFKANQAVFSGIVWTVYVMTLDAGGIFTADMFVVVVVESICSVDCRACVVALPAEGVLGLAVRIEIDLVVSQCF